MGFVHVSHPWVLAMVVPVWAAMLWPALARRPGATGRAILGCLAAGFLLAALAGPSVEVSRQGGAELCILRDVSRSMACAAGRPGADLAVQMAGLTGLSRIEDVVFDSRARPASAAEAVPAGPPGTDIEKGLELAAASLPASRGMILLYSDALETSGDASRAAARLAARGIQVHALLPEFHAVPDVRIASLAAVAPAEPGGVVRIRVGVAADVAATARLRLRREPAAGAPAASWEKVLNLGPGLGGSVDFQDTAGAAGVLAYRAEVAAENDTVPENNRASLLVSVGPPRTVLYVYAGPNPGRALAWLDRDAPAGVRSAPVTEGLVLAPDTAVVVLDNIAAVGPLGEETARRLARRVRDGGLGLLVLGGDSSFSAGAYGDSPLDDLLPVTSRTAHRPPLDMVFVIDASGSMNETVGLPVSIESNGQGRVLKLTLAKQSVLAIRPALAEGDRVGIVAFDGGPEVKFALPLRPVAEWASLRHELLALQAGGGTRITPALEAARRLFPPARPDDKTIRHVLLLSDGRSDDFQVESLVQAFRAARISASAVATGTYADTEADRLVLDRLRRLAEETGGRLYRSPDLARLAETLVKDMAVERGQGLTPGPASAGWRKARPAWMAPGPPLPPVPAYNPTLAKGDATVLWAADIADMNDHPLLALWRQGLGEVAAMPWPVSGASDAWAADDALPRYLSETVAHLRGPVAWPDWSARLAERQGRLVLRIEQPPAALGQGHEGFDASLLSAGAAEAAPIDLQETAPGVFEADLDTPEGTAAMIVVHHKGAPAEQLVLEAPAMPPKEFDRFGPNRARLEAIVRAGGGTIHTSLNTAAEAFAQLETRDFTPAGAYLLLAAAAVGVLLVGLRLAGKG